MLCFGGNGKETDNHTDDLLKRARHALVLIVHERESKKPQIDQCRTTKQDIVKSVAKRASVTAGQAGLCPERSQASVCIARLRMVQLGDCAHGPNTTG